MRISSYDQLHKLLISNSLNHLLLIDTFKIISPEHHYFWSNIDEIEAKAREYSIEQNWDSENVLVLHTQSHISKQATSEPSEPSEDFDISIGPINFEQVACSLHPNMTLEKLAETINRLGKMKAFL